MDRELPQALKITEPLHTLNLASPTRPHLAHPLVSKIKAAARLAEDRDESQSSKKASNEASRAGPALNKKPKRKDRPLDHTCHRPEHPLSQAGPSGE